MNKKIHKMFEITSVCRGDIMGELIEDGMKESEAEKEVLKLTDEDMRRIAKKLADQFCNCCYWEALMDIYENVKGD